MAGVKRSHDANILGEVEPVSSKRPCVSGDVTAPSNTTASSGSGPASLLTLPTEIVQQILFISREPNLIHTCRALYQTLPSYVSYTRTLMFLAFRDEGQFWGRRTAEKPWGEHFVCPIRLPIPELTSLELGPRDLQIELSKSKWLTPAILQETHIRLFEHVMNETVLYSGMPITPSEREEYGKTIIKIYRTFSFARASLPLLEPRKCPDDRFDGVTISMEPGGAWLKILQYGARYFIPVFRSYVMPDCVLADLPNFMSVELTEAIACSDYPCEMSASPDMMQQAILKALRDPVPLKYNERPFFDLARLLLELNEQCEVRPPLQIEMLAAAVQGNKAESLLDLLNSLPDPEDNEEYEEKIPWDRPITIEDLVRLELSLQAHQVDCYEALAELIETIFPHGANREVAQKLGFGSVRVLETARAAVNEMFNFGETEESESEAYFEAGDERRRI